MAAVRLGYAGARPPTREARQQCLMGASGCTRGRGRCGPTLAGAQDGPAAGGSTDTVAGVQLAQ